MKNSAENINILGQFCGKRDIAELTQEQLQKKYGISQADVMVLFGGSILCGGDVLAEAMQNKVARKYVIVGGAGHTTEALRKRMHQEYPAMETDGLPEAQVFAGYPVHYFITGCYHAASNGSRTAEICRHSRRSKKSV